MAPGFKGTSSRKRHQACRDRVDLDSHVCIGCPACVGLMRDGVASNYQPTKIGGRSGGCGLTLTTERGWSRSAGRALRGPSPQGGSRGRPPEFMEIELVAGTADRTLGQVRVAFQKRWDRKRTRVDGHPVGADVRAPPAASCTGRSALG